MKRIVLLSCLFAACLFSPRNAQAQYAPRIHRDHDGFVTQDWRRLSDDELIDLVGEDIYFDTVVGARKQYNAGRKLLTGGLIGIGAGYLAASGGTYMLAEISERRVRREMEDGRRYYNNWPESFYAGAGALLAITGYTALISGFMALEAGIPLRIIGQSRLNWVENDFNERQGLTCRFGPADHGFGLTLTF